jgi:FtsP/CotA-like multicopper oxidase with cupredoxin domain
MLSLLALIVAMAPMPLAAPEISAPAITMQAPCPPPPTSSKLVDPPDLYAKNGVLDVTLTLTQQVTGGSPQLCWVYTNPATGKLTNIPPTFNVRQGERLSITLVNTLTIPNPNVPTPPPLQIDRGGPGNAKPMAMPMAKSKGPPDYWALMCGQPQLAPTPTPDPVTGRIYHYERPPWNEANLHFHGLNTSPKAPGDDVVNVLLCPRLTATGSSYHYIVDIPRNEPPGLYWYHPHAHGESLYQVFMGLTGAIVVHSFAPSIPDKLPNRIAVVRDTAALQGILKYPLPMYRKAVEGQPNISQIRQQLATFGMPDYVRGPGRDPFQAEDECPGPKIPFNTTSVTINQRSLPLNGNTLFGLPTTKIGLGETQYWRLANTDGQTSLDLVLLVNGKSQPFMVTERDGVPLVINNGKPTYQPVAMNHIFLTPAGRIEFYLTGAVPGANMVIRTQEINTGCVGDTDLARDLFNVKVGTQQVVQHVTIPPATDPVALRFSDLALQKPVRKRTFIFTEYIRTDQAEPDFYITEVSNPKAVEHPYRMTGPPDTVVKEGTVEEWTLLNYTNEIHGFHIHQIHFMPISGAQVAEGLDQMVDTVLIPHGGYDKSKTFHPRGVKILMDFRGPDIEGEFVYHCHFLEHEDNGMMARILVTKP